MKRTIVAVVFLLILAALYLLTNNTMTASTEKTSAKADPTGFVYNANTYQQIVDNSMVRVSVQSPSRPFYFETNGVSSGFNPDFAKLLFAQTEFASKSPIAIDARGVDTYPAVPEQLLAKAGKGFAADIAMDGLTFPDNDPAGVVYSIPYVEDFGYALIAAQGSTLTASTTAGKKIGILKGDPDVKNFAQKAFPQATLVELSDESINGERIWMSHFIKSGAVDGIVYDYPFGSSELKGTDLVFVASKLDGSDIKYKIAVRKEDTQLLMALNSAIAKVKQTPQYTELLRKYFMSNQVVVAQATGQETAYEVKQGDTLGVVASKVKSTVQALQKRNNIPNPNLIYPGQKLIISK